MAVSEDQGRRLDESLGGKQGRSAENVRTLAELAELGWQAGLLLALLVRCSLYSTLGVRPPALNTRSMARSGQVCSGQATSQGRPEQGHHSRAARTGNRVEAQEQLVTLRGPSLRD